MSDMVGGNIRAARKRQGLSVADLAERCAQYDGHLTAPVIENIEHGRRRGGERTRDITIDEMVAIARALEILPSVLMPQVAPPGAPPGEGMPVTLENSANVLALMETNLAFMRQYFDLLRQQQNPAVRGTPAARKGHASGSGMQGGS